MQVNLKKAHKLVKQLKEVVNQISLNETVELSAYSDTGLDAISVQLDQKRGELNTNFTRFVEATNAMYELRAAIEAVNLRVGVNAKLNTLNNCVDLIGKLSKVTKEKDSAADVVSRRLTKIANKSSDTYSRYDEDSVSVSLSAQVTDYLTTIKKQKSEIEDDLLALNISNSISLSDGVVHVLTDSNIL